jgi:hypothetical protein
VCVKRLGCASRAGPCASGNLNATWAPCCIQQQRQQPSLPRLRARKPQESAHLFPAESSAHRLPLEFKPCVLPGLLSALCLSKAMQAGLPPAMASAVVEPGLQVVGVKSRLPWRPFGGWGGAVATV